MDTAHRLFILAVEEMNFTKAAQRGFVTQQCLSSNIKKLETNYHVKLFDRAPHLTLTLAGEALYETLRQIGRIEDGFHKRVRDISEGSSGHISFGINSSRARLLLPGFFEEYSKQFPHVQVSTILDDTTNMVQKMLRGDLDLFLGIDCPAHEQLEATPVTSDTVYLIATQTFLQQWYRADTGSLKDIDGPLDLRWFPNMPFVGTISVSTTNQLIRRYLDAQNICPNQVFAISDYETQISLCGRHMVAAFCPKLILKQVIRYNRLNADREPVRIFYLRDMCESTRIELIRPRKIYSPYYIERFITMMKEYIQAYSQETQSSIGPYLEKGYLPDHFQKADA